MTDFVHIADERDAAAIRRAGLTLPKARLKKTESDWYKYGIFAMPVVPNFVITHQWVRELKRSGFKTAIGIYFRIPDDQPVWHGLFGRLKTLATAAEAAAILARDETLGFETIIPRSIGANEIRAVRPLPQTLGWRYYPDAQKRGLFCRCRFCNRGKIRSRRLWEGYETD
mgnify:CR=1 FL=1